MKNNIIDKFQEDVSKNGYHVDKIFSDGKIHRFKINNKLDGWYVLFVGKYSNGVYGDWKTGNKYSWSSKDYRTLSAKELHRYNKYIRKCEKKLEGDKRKRRINAKRRANKLWDKSDSIETNEHPYLQQKGIKAYGLKVNSAYNKLLIPIFDIEGHIHNIQKISESGEKRFMPDGSITGLCFSIPATKESDEIYICEGYATGASIHEATGGSVYVAFNAGNMKPLTESLVEKFPNKNFILCADNDAFTVDLKGVPNNVGLSKGFDIAWELNLKLAYPTFKDTSSKPTDFNDLHQLEGLVIVLDQINQAKSPEDWLLQEAKINPGAPFELKNLYKLTILKQNNTSRYMQIRNKLKTLKIPITMLETEMKKIDIPNGEKPGLEQSRIAEKIAEGLVNRYAFNSESEQWFIYKTGLWLKILSQDFTRIVYNELKTLLPGHSDPYLNGTVNLIKNEIPFNISKKGKYKHLLPFTNGLFDINKREIVPHDPKYYFTWQLPYSYDSDAECDAIINWLTETTGGDMEKVQLLRAYLNAIMFGRTNLHKFIELIGPGGSGKSTFQWLAEQLVGEKNCMTSSLKVLEQSRFETATLYGKKLLLITDAERYVGEISVLKAITGGDPIRYEEKFVQSKNQFHPEALVIIAANEPIQSAENTSGLRRRRITVTFGQAVPEDQQRDLTTEFKPLIGGLINWILDMSEKEVHKILKSTRSYIQQSESKEILIQTNPMAAWLNANIIYLKNYVIQIGIAKKIKDDEDVEKYENEDDWLYPNYVKYCSNTRNKPVSTKRFSNALIDLCVSQLHIDVKLLDKDRDGRKIQGLKIKDDSNEGISPVEFALGYKEVTI